MEVLKNYISFFGLNIRIYSLIGVLSGFFVWDFFKYWIMKRHPKWNVSEGEKFLIPFVIWVLVGARLWFVLSNINYYWQQPFEIIQVWKGGIAIQGGIIAALIFASYLHYKKKLSIPVSEVLGTLFTLILIGQAMGRWGNFFNREIYGQAISQAQTSWWVNILLITQFIGFALLLLINKPWQELKNPQFKNYAKTKITLLLLLAIFFVYTFLFGFNSKIIDNMYINNSYRQPLFLLQGSLNIWAALILMYFSSKKNFFLLPTTLVFWGIIRALVETLRDEIFIMKIANVSVSLVTSWALIIFGVIFFYLQKHHLKNDK